MTSPVVSPTDDRTLLDAERLEPLALVSSGEPSQPLAELAEAPITIGAGPRCTIRLTGKALRPLQCVVTPTAAGPRVRSWATGVLLNGQAFDEAPLACGDRLQFGEIELRVIHLVTESDTEADLTHAQEQPVATGTAQETPVSEPASKELTDASEIDLADLAGHEWAIPSDYTSDALPLAEGMAESVQAWNAALPGEATSEPTATLPESQAFQDELDGLRNQLAETFTSAHESTAQIESLSRRQKNNRRRVSRLVEALRRQYGDADLLRLALEQREQETVELQSRLESALALGDTVRDEIAALEARHAQELQAQAEQLEADYALKLAEAQAVHVVGEDPPPAEESLEVAAEPSWAEAEAAGPSPVEADSVEPQETMWNEAAPEAPELLATPPVETPVVPEHPSVEESPWGIEQLAPSETDPSDEAEASANEAEPEETAQVASVAETPTLISTDWFAAETEPAVDEQQAPEATEGPSHTEPQSFIEKYGHLLPDEDEQVEPVVETETTPEPNIESVDDVGPADDSIDDYMHRLMQRVRGEEPASEGPNEHGEAEPAETDPVTQETSEPEPSVQPIQCLSEISRSEAPEANADMDALRQLANHSARSAIQVASKKEGRANATLYLASSVIGIVVGAMASMTAASPYGVQFIGGLIAVIGCGWYGVKMLGFFQAVNAAEELGEEH